MKKKERKIFPFPFRSYAQDERERRVFDFCNCFLQELLLQVLPNIWYIPIPKNQNKSPSKKPLKAPPTSIMNSD